MFIPTSFIFMDIHNIPRTTVKEAVSPIKAGAAKTISASKKIKTGESFGQKLERFLGCTFGRVEEDRSTNSIKIIDGNGKVRREFWKDNNGDNDAILSKDGDVLEITSQKGKRTTKTKFNTHTGDIDVTVRAEDGEIVRYKSSKVKN